ncbi:MAG: hypothetical protein JW731_13035, partial [Bacteroidales bacterium]|nr:hypothetical protein [Bacteroidales bacterium]
MKAFLLISTILLNSQLLFSQQKTEVYFGHPNKWDQADDIIELYDKGYFITGGYEGDPHHFGWNIKTDINLEFIYDKVMEHDLSTVAQFAATSDENGNIYVTGFTTYPDQWPFVTKLDSCGTKVWCKILIYEDEYTNGWSNDIILNGNNEVIILVTLTDNEQPEDQINMTHLIGLNDEGEVLWKKPYASRNDYSWIRQPQGYTIKEVNEDYYISGFCYWPYPDDTTHFFLRPLFIGIDSFFEEKWILPFAPLDSVFGDAYDVIAINDSIILGVGERLLEGYDMNTLFMFFNTNGQEIGYNQIPNEDIGSNVDFNAIRNIEAISDTEFLSPLYVGIDFDTYFGELTYDTSGSIQNQMIRGIYSGTSSITKTFDDKYVIAIEVDENKADDDIYVYKIDENLNDVPFDPTPLTYDSLCPG